MLYTIACTLTDFIINAAKKLKAARYVSVLSAPDIYVHKGKVTVKDSFGPLFDFTLLSICLEYFTTT